MAKAEIEIRRTVTITREESARVTVDVPQDILDDPDGDFGLHDWAEAELKITSSELAKATLSNWDHVDEDESSEIDEVINHDEG